MVDFFYIHSHLSLGWYMYDAEYRDIITKHSWRADKDGYARTNCPYHTYGRGKTITLHQFVWNLKNHRDPYSKDYQANDMVIDHIDMLKWNNCQWNLRVLARNINAGKITKYCGSYWHKTKRRWVAQIRWKRKSRHLGYFDTELESAHAYNQFIIDKRLNRALNNFPEE